MPTRPELFAGPARAPLAAALNISNPIKTVDQFKSEFSARLTGCRFILPSHFTRFFFVFKQKKQAKKALKFLQEKKKFKIHKFTIKTNTQLI